jgi:site-specific recombinase XerD
MNAKITNLFYVKRAKSNNLGLVPIFHRVTVDGQRIERSTCKYIDADLWSAEAARMKGKSEQARSINNHLEKLINEVSEAEKYLTIHNKQVDYVNLKNILTGKEEKARTLVPIFQEHNTRIQALVLSNEFAQGTVERYKITLRHLQNFLESKYGLKDIHINEIDFAFIMDFDFYLRTVRKCQNNASVKYVKNFRKIFNICLANEWVTSDPFKKYKSKTIVAERDYLTEHELHDIISKNITIPRLELVRDIFIFSCFTGLAYIDVQQLTTDNIALGIDGEKWIFKNRQKTDTASKIPLLPTAQEIIEKYENHPVCKNENRLLPIFTNQKMNSYLKEIADICGIKKPLTFHIARHTFATTVTLSNGVPLETVSKMLGHTNLKTTQHYAKILDMKISEDMMILKSKYSAGSNLTIQKSGT